MTRSSALREASAASWDAAVGHRFVQELWQDRVPRSALTTYFVQDNQFLDDFLALLGASVAGADRAAPRVVLARQLGVVAGPENDFFVRTLDALDVPATDRAAPELLAPTRDFRALMREAADGRDYAGCLAVLLVAEWMYLDWATHPGAALPADPIGREWIELHTGPEFTAWVDFLRAEFDRVGAALDTERAVRVRALFTRAVALELAFFNAAYTP